MKKTINMRSGFTMIELVFVIVIIGILSAVALPKFLETSNQAHDAAVKSFVGSLNRTTGPTMWAKSIANGLNGVVTTYCGNLAGPDADDYIALPEELDVSATACEFTAKDGAGSTLDVDLVFAGDAVRAPEWKTTVVVP